MKFVRLEKYQSIYIFVKLDVEAARSCNVTNIKSGCHFITKQEYICVFQSFPQIYRIIVVILIASN